MGKRSDFKRMKNDFYATPYEAVLPLLPFLPRVTKFIEPCSGQKDLVRHLIHHGHECVCDYDIDSIPSVDATQAKYHFDYDYFITNPPWTRSILHEIIMNLSYQAPTWLLFDADWMHTKQAIPYLPYCEKIVSVGRVKWIPDSKHHGKDNSCWYLFYKKHTTGPQFYGRTKE